MGRKGKKEKKVKEIECIDLSSDEEEEDDIDDEVEEGSDEEVEYLEEIKGHFFGVDYDETIYEGDQDNAIRVEQDEEDPSQGLGSGSLKTQRVQKRTKSMALKMK